MYVRFFFCLNCPLSAENPALTRGRVNKRGIEYVLFLRLKIY